MFESNVSRRTFIAASAAIAACGMTACAGSSDREVEQGPGIPAPPDSDAAQVDSQSGRGTSERVSNLLAGMSLEQKIAQMIMPAIRTWEGEDNSVTVLRTITKISKLFDVSAVSLPANDATSISARSYGEGVIAEAKEEILAHEKQKQKIRILTEVTK